MQIIFHSILPIFALTLIGLLIKSFWLTSTEFWKGLEKLSYFFLFPVALFNYISHASFTNTNVFNLIQSLVFATLIISLGVLRVGQIYKIDHAVFTSVFQGSIRFNSYIFIGVASTLYDINGLSVLAITCGYMMIITNILSVLVFNYFIKDKNVSERNLIENSIKIIYKLFSNPLIVSCMLGFAANHLNITFDGWIDKLFSNISTSATAIGIMCVGAGLKLSITTTHMKFALTTCLIKLIVTPLITILSLKIFNITGVAKSIGILYSALPCASTSYILSQQLGGDADSMAFIVTLSIILSLISMTLIMTVFA